MGLCICLSMENNAEMHVANTSNSCPLTQWCYLTISSSTALFSYCPQSLPSLGSLPMSWPFTSGSQSTRASGSASILPINIQGWFPLRLIGLISLLAKGLSRDFANTTVQKCLLRSAFFMVQFSHPYMTTGKTTALTRWTFVDKVMSLLLNHCLGLS